MGAEEARPGYLGILKEFELPHRARHQGGCRDAEQADPAPPGFRAAKQGFGGFTDPLRVCGGNHEGAGTRHRGEVRVAHFDRDRAGGQLAPGEPVRSEPYQVLAGRALRLCRVLS
jgi:hypothetical protein